MHVSHSHLYCCPPQNPENVLLAKLGAPTGYLYKHGPCVLYLDLRYRSGTKMHVQPVGPKQGLEQNNSFQLQP